MVSLKRKAKKRTNFWWVGLHVPLFLFSLVEDSVISTTGREMQNVRE